MHDLAGRADVAILVEAFYRRALTDDLIGRIFTDVARMDLEHHLPIITDFWETVLFNAGRYRRNLLELHAALDRRFPLEEVHFERWLGLWTDTVDELFAGPTAERAKSEARRVAASIGRRLQGRSGSAFETVSLRADAGEARGGAQSEKSIGTS
jgi:truncated hemoglobin YjbI